VADRMVVAPRISLVARMAAAARRVGAVVVADRILAVADRMVVAPRISLPARIGGGPHGGPGFHAMAVHGGPGHAGRGPSFGHAASAHGLHIHGPIGHAMTNHGIHGANRYAGHNLNHGQGTIGNAGRFANHGLNGNRNAFTHNQPGGHEAFRNQFAHNNGALSHQQITHNQLAAQNFHGLNNVSRTG
jgi:hypothetical protein